MLVFWDSWLRSSAFLHSSTCLGRCYGRPGRQDRSQHLGANCQGTIHSLEWRWLDLWAHWWRDYPRGPGHWCNRVTLRRIFLPPADEICCEAYQRSGQDVFNKAMVTSAEEACERAEKIGFPIMVKASEGRPQGWRRNIYIYILYFFRMHSVHTYIYIYVQVRYGTIFEYQHWKYEIITRRYIQFTFLGHRFNRVSPYPDDNQVEEEKVFAKLPTWRSWGCRDVRCVWLLAI